MSPSEIKTLMAAVLDLLFYVFSGLRLRGSRVGIAVNYSAWLGLGELQHWKPKQILQALQEVEIAVKTLDDTVKDLQNACDEEHAPADDPRRILIRTPRIIPYCTAIAKNEKWDFQTMLSDRANKDYPPYPDQNKFCDMPMKVLTDDIKDQPEKVLKSFKRLRVDRAVAAQLGSQLSNPINKAGWRIYASLVGACIFAGMKADRRRPIVKGTLISGFAWTRFKAELAERQAEAMKKEEKERAEKEKADKKKVEAK